MNVCVNEACHKKSTLSAQIVWKLGSSHLESELNWPPKDHHCQLRGTAMGTVHSSFIYTQELKNTATWWLQLRDATRDQQLREMVVLEQFVDGLSIETADWVKRISH